MKLAAHYPQFTAAWNALFPGDAPPPLDWFELHYGAPYRYYHNWQHISRMIDLHNSLCPGPRTSDLQEWSAVIVAIWYHDVVYLPGQPTNEANSAGQLVSYAPRVNSRYLDLAVQMIRASTHTDDRSGEPEVVQYFLDLDMAGLGDPPLDFALTTEKVHDEYITAFSEAEWRTGRAKFWQYLLAQPNIYYNPYDLLYFRQREAQARANINAELTHLQLGS